jgi:hypothetical protein
MGRALGLFSIEVYQQLLNMEMPGDFLTMLLCLRSGSTSCRICIPVMNIHTEFLFVQAYKLLSEALTHILHCKKF